MSGAYPPPEAPRARNGQVARAGTKTGTTCSGPTGTGGTGDQDSLSVGANGAVALTTADRPPGYGPNDVRVGPRTEGYVD